MQELNEVSLFHSGHNKVTFYLNLSLMLSNVLVLELNEAPLPLWSQESRFLFQLSFVLSNYLVQEFSEGPFLISHCLCNHLPVHSLLFLSCFLPAFLIPLWGGMYDGVFSLSCLVLVLHSLPAVPSHAE